MIEIAITNELNSITELQNKVFPVSSPKKTPTPYLIYNNTSTVEEYTIQGVTGYQRTIFIFNLYCDSYSNLKIISQKIKEKLLTFLQKDVGGFFIQSVRLEYNGDFFENTVNLYRAIYSLEIYY